MPDWSSPLEYPQPSCTIVSTQSLACEYARASINFAGNNAAAGTWPAANRAVYMAFQVGRPCTAFQMVVGVSVSSGNADVGIYDEAGTRLVSAGSTAVGPAGAQVFNIADTNLSPGTYWTAMCVDNTTASFNRHTTLEVVSLRVAGVQEQAVGAVTLPATATFANPSSAYMPVIAIGVASTAL